MLLTQAGRREVGGWGLRLKGVASCLQPQEHYAESLFVCKYSLTSACPSVEITLQYPPSTSFSRIKLLWTLFRGTENALILLLEKGDIFLPIISPRHQEAQCEGADTFLNSSE